LNGSHAQQANPIDNIRLSRIVIVVNTIIETTIFSAKATKIWTRRHYEEFIIYIANNPLAGEVVPGSGGVRKVRWVIGDTGKRGGVRVIYFNSTSEQTWLLTLYAKNERENIPSHELKKIKEAING
jgi:hypothetical protein